MERTLHDDWLFLYCVGGCAYLKIDGVVSKVRPGDLIFLPKGTTHAYWADDENPWTVYWVHFTGRQIHEYIDELLAQPSPHLLSVGVRDELIQSFKSLLTFSARDNDFRVFIYSANVLKQMLTFLSFAINTFSPGKETSGRLNMAAVHQYFEQQIDTFLDLDRISSHFYMSKYHFAKTYKSLTGQSPISAFIHQKMKKAKHLLDSTDLSVKQIGAELGYPDPYYFSRVFKKSMGMSPKHFRELDKG